MSDKLKIQQQKVGGNVVSVPPRVKTITHKGLFGKIEFHPIKKIWSSTVKLLYPITHTHEHKTEAEASLKVKEILEQASNGNNKRVRTE